MTAIGRLSLRLAIYGAALLYLAGDLFLFNGPLKQRIDSRADAIAPDAVARVFSHTITRGQLDRAVHERLRLEGRDASEVTPAERKQRRYAALTDLIDHELLRMKVKVNTFALPVSDEAIEREWSRFTSRFSSNEDLAAALNAEGLDETSARQRVAARLQQMEYIRTRVDPLVVIEDAELERLHRATADPRPLEEAAPELRQAIQAAKRAKAAERFRESLREFEAKHIHVFHDRLAD